MNNNNKNKDKLLGMPHGTATGRLRKSVIFMLAGRLKLLTCFRCNKLIQYINDFSIEHQKAWQQAADPKKTFFDLSNIAFSHLGCNAKFANRSREIVVTHGMLTMYDDHGCRCAPCKKAKSIKNKLRYKLYGR